MCGIFCFICKGEGRVNQNEEVEYCQESIRNRGPDGFQKLYIHLTGDWYALFVSSVLWTQGSEITLQPIFKKDVLLWNGDIFSGLEMVTEGKSDTCALFNSINGNCLDVMSSLCGPFAFIYWDSNENKLYFGRDIIGRHSLLWCITKSELLLTSVAVKRLESIEEVPSVGIFVVDLTSPEIGLELHPWSYFSEKFPDKLPEKVWIMRSEISHFILKKEIEHYWFSKGPSESDLKHYKDQRGKCPDEGLDYLLTQEDILSRVKQLQNFLMKSVQTRVCTKPQYCQECANSKSSCTHPKVAVLFSGGLDSSLLALMTDTFVPREEAIDLLNVAFERKLGSGFHVPDRKTGLKSLDELRKLCPNREWNFIEINITQEELEFYRRKTIQNLIHPLRSVLDDGLGCALWFAASGKGLLDREKYKSPARIILLGIGADELFGGYSRHRKIYSEKGWAALGKELHRELKEIGSRNLGRDNRVISDHGRQPRTPFLDENLLAFADQLPPWHKCCLDLPPGFGDKLLLRLAARHLGFREVASFPKKALQFGSRIANPKEKGHEISLRL